jgi:hypothetical protein
MPVARVIRHEVEEDADTAPIGLRDQLVDVGVGTEIGLDGAVVGDVSPSRHWATS